MHATSAFADTGVQITTEGKRHLGAAIGSHCFTKEYVTGKVEEWTQNEAPGLQYHNPRLHMQRSHTSRAQEATPTFYCGTCLHFTIDTKQITK